MKFRTNQIVAVVPSYNESKTIVNVIQELQQHCDVLVVDDGSSDDTYQLSISTGSHVISHSFNRGYDQALESGLKWAGDHGYLFAITFDADGQHSAELIPAFIEKFESGADLVLGVRDSTQRWAEYIFARFSKFFWGIDDPLCGMKGYRLTLLQNNGYFNTYSSIGTEFCIKAARSGCTICQVSMPTTPRADQSRFGGGFKPNFKILKAIWLGLFYARSFNDSNL